jgi:hypothetical protein
MGFHPSVSGGFLRNHADPFLRGFYICHAFSSFPNDLVQPQHKIYRNIGKNASVF